MPESLPTTMQAVTIDGGNGPLEAMHLTTLEIPKPGEHQMLVKVHAAGVNRPDIGQRRGTYPPPPGWPETMGLELSGEVVVGSGRWKIGDRITALVGGGAYAEYALADARYALPIPAGMDFIDAAALPETIFTVYANMLEGGALKAGETLLVHGGTSGIGVAAIQMAKALGAKVIATSRGAAKTAAALDLGADVSVDTTREDFLEVCKREGGVDVVIDIVAGDFVPKELEALNSFGRLVFVSAQAGETVSLPIRPVMAKRLTITGSMLRPRPPEEKARLAAAVERIVWPWVEAGKVRQPIDKVFSLAEAGQAHAWMEGGAHVGKIMLKVV